MEQEAAMGMLEKLGKLREMLVDYEREMQRLKIENDWLKMVLSDCEKKRVDAKGGRIIDMTRPQPCVKFRDASAMAWVAKLIEKTHEVVQEVHIILQLGDDEALKELYQDAEKRLALELTDVITVCTSWLDAEGYDEEERGKLQEMVNEKNKARGYWG